MSIETFPLSEYFAITGGIWTSGRVSGANVMLEGCPCTEIKYSSRRRGRVIGRVISETGRVGTSISALWKHQKKDKLRIGCETKKLRLTVMGFGMCT